MFLNTIQKNPYSFKERDIIQYLEPSSHAQ
ncbi:MAG: hypothetical protein ACD_78C00042G0001, partial [uncultured bacterium (gcode 4)]